MWSDRRKEIVHLLWALRDLGKVGHHCRWMFDCRQRLQGRTALALRAQTKPHVPLHQVWVDIKETISPYHHLRKNGVEGDGLPKQQALDIRELATLELVDCASERREGLVNIAIAERVR